MAEITFADGVKTVDDVYVDPIQRVTNGEPERYPFQSVMDQLGTFVEKSILRETQKNVISEHFRQWG